VRIKIPLGLLQRGIKVDVKIYLRKNLQISFAYNSGSSPARVLRQLMLKGMNDECYSKDITFPANKYN